MARHGESRVAKAAIISAVPPLMVKTAANPGGLPKEVFDGLQAQLAANRSEFYRDLPAGPFYGYNRPGAKPSEAIIQNWWRQGMMGGAKAHYDGIVAFSQTDFTEDLKKITVPVLVMHGEDDQIVPYADCRAVVGKAFEERNAEDLQGLPARHADHAGGHDQRRLVSFHQVLTSRIRMSAHPADIHPSDCKPRLVQHLRDCPVALHALNADLGWGHRRIYRHPDDFVATNALPLM